jgi:Lipid A 3-O-deacylase (PagL)
MKYLDRFSRLGFAAMNLAATLSVFSLGCHSNAQDYLAGVRAGGSFENDAGDFQQAEVFGGIYLPWRFGSKTGFSLKPRIEGSAGCLDNRGEAGFIAASGPVLEFRKGKFPVTLEAGVNLTALSRYNYEDKDLGGWFQFTDHVGLNWHITKHFTVGWRFQHMSNAGIYRSNPGLNQQMLSTSYSF